MYILVFIPFFFEGGGGARSGEGVDGYIFMGKSPGFEIGKLGNYAGGTDINALIDRSGIVLD